MGGYGRGGDTRRNNDISWERLVKARKASCQQGGDFVFFFSPPPETKILDESQSREGGRKTFRFNCDGGTGGEGESSYRSSEGEGERERERTLTD